MVLRGRKAGFTLVEMLVVIGIIVVLVAILFPVFTSARQKATMTQCRTKMHQLVMALKDYKRDHHRYPPQPYHDDTLGMYIGGFSALYPDYTDSWDALICPSDRTIEHLQDEAKNRRYSSYNGVIALAEDSSLDATQDATWHFAAAAGGTGAKITYNYYGYDDDGYDIYTDATCDKPGATARPTWLAAEGKKWKHYPRLMNRYAPDNTIVTHCPHHRSFYNEQGEWQDNLVRLGGDSKQIATNDWMHAPVGEVSKFKHQQY